MIKYVKTAANGRKLIAFGLSEENIKRLQANDPIFLTLEDVGIEGIDIGIYSGTTEDDMAKEINEGRAPL